MLSTLLAADLPSRLDGFDTVIDARSPSEFAEDHLPGAVNWPTLDDAQRAEVGTQYKHESAFDAKKRGAAMAARNIADHIEREVMAQPRGWQPLVYCWRGGSRSGSLATVLDQIGFKVHRLDGGYLAFRRAVLASLETLPTGFDFRVVCGTTGSGKSRLLQRLRERGAQVLDLEGLANHRGSVLGLVPGERQPSQKRFDTFVWDALRRADPARPIFIESESKKVGDLRVPPALIDRMRASRCLQLELPLDARVALLLDEYDHFVHDTDAFCARLDALRTLRGHATIDAWQAAARTGDAASVVRALLTDHYDPIYLQSMARNFPALAAGPVILRWDGTEPALTTAADAAMGEG